MEDDLVYAADPALWAREILGYHPDTWQEKLLRSRSKKIILGEVCPYSTVQSVCDLP
jgi:hypothetical protein